MSGISTHVLDLTHGRPAVGVPVTLQRQAADGTWETVHRTATDADGRAHDLLAGTPLRDGLHRLTFATAEWFRARGVEPFFPEISIAFAARAGEHHHVPLLLTPHGYSTYRGT